MVSLEVIDQIPSEQEAQRTIVGHTELFARLYGLRSSHITPSTAYDDWVVTDIIDALKYKYGGIMDQDEIHTLTCLKPELQDEDQPQDEEDIVQKLQAYVGKTGRDGLVVVRGIDMREEVEPRYACVAEQLLKMVNQLDQPALLTIGEIPYRPDAQAAEVSTRLASLIRGRFYLDGKGLITDRE